MDPIHSRGHAGYVSDSKRGKPVYWKFGNPDEERKQKGDNNANDDRREDNLIHGYLLVQILNDSFYSRLKANCQGNLDKTPKTGYTCLLLYSDRTLQHNTKHTPEGLHDTERNDQTWRADVRLETDLHHLVGDVGQLRRRLRRLIIHAGLFQNRPARSPKKDFLF